MAGSTSRALDGQIVAQTPIYTGPPEYPLNPGPEARMLVLPSLVGGLQTGRATYGTRICTNGIDALPLGSQARQKAIGVPQTAGRVVALSLDTKTESWRHERPKIALVGGPAPKPTHTNVGDPVGSGIAAAQGVVYFTSIASGKLVALDAEFGAIRKELKVGPV